MTPTAIFYVVLSAVIDIIANMCIAKSQGFKQIKWGIGAIILIWIAFGFLGEAIKTIDLAVAYTLWGAIGVIGTALFGRIIFGHKLKPIGWFGIFMVTVAVILLSMD